MGTLENILAELDGKKRDAIDGQLFTYGFRAFISNFAKHNTSAFQGNPLATPGLGQIRFRCEEDAHFRINTVTMSAYGPVNYDATLAPDDADQDYLLDSVGGTNFPLPGLVQSKPNELSTITAVNVGTDTLTITGGFSPRDGHTLMFQKGAGGVLPGGLSDNVLYRIGSVAGNDITVGDMNGNSVNITSAGSGLFYAVLVAVATFSNSGGKLLVTNGGVVKAKGTPIVFVTYGVGVLPSNIVAGQQYYLVPISITTSQLVSSPAKAYANPVSTIAYVDSGSGVIYGAWGGIRAERGLAVAISDVSKITRVLTSDGLFPAFLPIETLFAPAYGTYNPGPMKVLEGYVLPKQHELLFQFKNRDTAGFLAADPAAEIVRRPDWGHMVQIALTGEKFYD